jgi:cyclic-di-GMP phosphodiesterase TipF (flagellum assembly factor)
MAAATAGVWLKLLGVDWSTSALISAVLTLLAAQVHASFLRRSHRRGTQQQIAALRQAGFEFSKELGETRRRIDELKTDMEAKATEQSRKIVSELSMIEGLMREFAARIAEKAKQVAPEVQIERRPPDSARSYLDTLGQSDLLEIIRAALEENRVDLYLQPIVTLPQRKLRYYEALSRLRSDDGTVIMPMQYMRIAEPAGLMSVVDNLLLFRCVQIVRRMMQKSRGVGVFCNISGATLGDLEFFPQFLEYMHHNRDLAAQIVFEFSQAAVREAGAKGEENLSYLASLGFALSMDHVDSLALDFAKLHALGFRFIKVRAGTLVGGMAHAGSAVAAEDLKKLLARHGISLIVERVEDEKTVVQLLDYGVDFGQGYLFGEPRAVREESAKRSDDTQQPAAPVVAFRKAG